MPAHDFLKHRRDRAQRNIIDAAAELLHGRGMRERSLGAEKSDAQRLFQRERSAHEFPIHRLQASIGKWPLIELSDFFEDRFLPIGRINRRFVLLLDLADFDDDAGTFIEQINDLVIELIDLQSQRRKGGGLGIGRIGRHERRCIGRSPTRQF